VIPPAGTYTYWADNYTLFVLEMALMGFAEHRRLQDWYNPGFSSIKLLKPPKKKNLRERRRKKQ
jgi:hypothetical protein